MNDGIATPCVMFAVSGIATAAALEHEDPGHALIGLLGGLVLGIAIGAAGGAALRMARRRGWSSDEFAGPAVLALALIAYLAAVSLEANGFVAAFVAGTAYGAFGGRGTAKEVYYVEQTCGLASMIAWLVFGAVLLPAVAGSWNWHMLIYALLSLTVVRMLPVAISLLGARVDFPTVLFIGWFGPRGLASIVFALIALEDLRGVAGPIDDVAGAIGLTVLLSVLAHGLSARPMVRRYAALTNAQVGGSHHSEPSVRRFVSDASDVQRSLD